MDNYKAENQEQEIDLVSLFFAVAHRYKQMAAAAVICAVLGFLAETSKRTSITSLCSI